MGRSYYSLMLFSISAHRWISVNSSKLRFLTCLTQKINRCEIRTHHSKNVLSKLSINVDISDCSKSNDDFSTRWLPRFFQKSVIGYLNLEYLNSCVHKDQSKYLFQIALTMLHNGKNSFLKFQYISEIKSIKYDFCRNLYLH